MLLSQYVAFNYRDYQTACVTKATRPINHHGVKWLWSGMEVDMSILTFFIFFFSAFLSFALYFCRPLFISGDEDEDEGGEERLPSCFDYVMHFLTVFWKVLFACVPPTEYWNGWACFIVSIVIIGLLTAVIGDLASHFGCTIGLKDSVTAVVFVALGTSIPGELAYAFICLHFYKYVFNEGSHLIHNFSKV